MYRRVLLAVDGSPGTEAAVDAALDLATSYGAGLEALYVVDSSAVPLDAHSRRLLQEREDWARETLDAVVDRAAAADVDPVTGAVRRGVPHRVILDYVDERDCDLVVVGTHGREGVERFVLGSVSERVIRLSPVPVLAVPADEAAEPDGEGREP